MAIGDARLLADGKEIYVANDLRVGLFLREPNAAVPAASQESASS
jgi:3-hydroxyacyl-[acyl-carrier protein] dehydratase/trans-2-decenoyl-[acyl-carrier protein] isomerase